jgi:hypothetical protein
MWRDQQKTVDTGDQARAALKEIAADPGGPFLMHVAPVDQDTDGPMIQLVYGHADRAMLTYTDHDFGGHAVDPDIAPAAADLDYDYGSVPPELTRLTDAQARQAVAESRARR